MPARRSPGRSPRGRSHPGGIGSPAPSFLRCASLSWSKEGPASAFDARRTHRRRRCPARSPPVIVVIGQRRVDLGQRDRRIVVDDLRRAHPVVLVPDGDVPDLDPMPADVRLPAAVAGLDRDVFAQERTGCGCHGTMALRPRISARPPGQKPARPHAPSAARRRSLRRTAAAELVGPVVLDEVDGTPGPARPRELAAEEAGRRLGRLDQGIQGRGAILEVVAAGGVRGRHQPAEFGDVPRLQRLGPAADAVVLRQDMPRRSRAEGRAHPTRARSSSSVMSRSVRT